VSWRSSPGKSDGPELLGWRRQNPYFLDFNDVCKPGGSALLEAPMTIVRLWPRADRLRAKLASRSVVRAALNRLMPPLSWLRPNGGNTRAMLRLLRRAMAEHRPMWSSCCIPRNSCRAAAHLPGRQSDRPAVSPDAHPFRSGARPVRAADTEASLRAATQRRKAPRPGARTYPAAGLRTATTPFRLPVGPFSNTWRH